MKWFAPVFVLALFVVCFVVSMSFVHVFHGEHIGGKISEEWTASLRLVVIGALTSLLFSFACSELLKSSYDLKIPFASTLIGLLYAVALFLLFWFIETEDFPAAVFLLGASKDLWITLFLTPMAVMFFGALIRSEKLSR